MSIAINLSPTLTDQLKNQAATLGVSLNELIEKLIYKSLSRKIEPEALPESISSEMIDSEAMPVSEIYGTDDNSGRLTMAEIIARAKYGTDDNSGRLTMAEIIARAKSRPHNPSSIHPPTGTLDDALAALEARPISVPRLTPTEWEMHWWPIRQEMRERDSTKSNPFDVVIERKVSA